MTSSRMTETDAELLPRELQDLGRLIETLPAGQQEEFNTVYQRVVESVKRRRRILSLVQEALSQLRLDIKYLMFDLEVTKSERDDLKERLGEH